MLSPFGYTNGSSNSVHGLKAKLLMVLLNNKTPYYLTQTPMFKLTDSVPYTNSVKLEKLY